MLFSFTISTLLLSPSIISHAFLLVLSHFSLIIFFLKFLFHLGCRASEIENLTEELKWDGRKFSGTTITASLYLSFSTSSAALQ